MTTQEKIKSVLISRKFWASVAGILVTVFGVDIPAEVQAQIIGLITFGYTLGTGIESGAKAIGKGG